MISECAEFDEHYFHTLKQKVDLPILPVVGSPPLDPILDSELDEVIDLGGGLELKYSKPVLRSFIFKIIQSEFRYLISVNSFYYSLDHAVGT
jgi:hypothetical protein